MTGLKAGVIGAGWFGEIHCNVIAVAALAAGKHVLLEKSMAPTVAKCEQICQAARDADTYLRSAMSTASIHAVSPPIRQSRREAWAAWCRSTAGATCPPLGPRTRSTK